MDKAKLENLKNDLNEYKKEVYSWEKAKKKDKESQYKTIQFLTKKLIKDYNLRKYDFGITMESYNPEYFIFDVETIINKIEKEKNDD